MTETVTKPLRIGVIGPAGCGGSYLCVELINRGHTVVGISRDPQKLGSHSHYHPHAADIEKSSIEQLAEVFRDVDVLVSEYGPHTAGIDALQYSKHQPLHAFRICHESLVIANLL